MAQGVKLNCRVISNGIEYKITTDHPIYGLRYVLLTRCYNASKRDFKFYQGRGIKVCDEWKNCFIAFFKWCLDNGWKKGLVLDRIDNNKDYEPNNCRFITAKENLQKMHIDHNMVGENSPRAKLTQLQVDEIRKKLGEGVMNSRLAKDYNVSPSTIKAIKSGQNWKDT